MHELFMGCMCIQHELLRDLRLCRPEQLTRAWHAAASDAGTERTSSLHEARRSSQLETG